jgi:hypothetical protein
MKRRAGAVVVVALLILAVSGALWMARDRGERTGAGAAATIAAKPTQAPPPLARSIDPRRQSRGSISGTVRSDNRVPIANAQVCGDASSDQLPDSLTYEARCTRTDAAGRYHLGDLLAADYTIGASAPRFRPRMFYPAPDRGDLAFPLAAGEHRTGVDVVLTRGGVEVIGTVVDLTGGPIRRALVRASRARFSGQGPPVETDEQGRFSLWTAPGPIHLLATADGHVEDYRSGRAPGSFEIALIPASSVAGVVIDAATDQPIEGARVTISSPRDGSSAAIDISDSQGRFYFEPLKPGRFQITAVADHRYGRSEGSQLVGLGHTVGGVIVKLFPAHRIAGKVVSSGSRQPCPDGIVRFSDSMRLRTVRSHSAAAGEHVADGVPPGTYTVIVECPGHRSRRYDPVVVGDGDRTGLVWGVDAGATIRGRVVGRSGEPRPARHISAESIRPHLIDVAARNGAWAESEVTPDGRYALTGLAAGTYRLTVESDRGVSPRDGYLVTIADAATLERDLVLDDCGAVTGTVVDESGASVPGMLIVADDTDRRPVPQLDDVRSDAGGAFTLEGLAPGSYRVTAQRSTFDRMESAISDDKQGVKVAVHAGQIAAIQLVVEAPTGAITGTVVDAIGRPVVDAVVAWVREAPSFQRRDLVEATRLSWDNHSRPVLASLDGAFALTRLSPGTYTVRAYRKGGGEAIAERVAVGAAVRLQITATASIEGTARRKGVPPRELTVLVRNPETGFSRRERFYMTGGRFAVVDLPAGQLEVVVTADGSETTSAVTLGEGEARTGLVVDLDDLVTAR